jgi:hypothetical protein
MILPVKLSGAYGRPGYAQIYERVISGILIMLKLSLFFRFVRIFTHITMLFLKAFPHEKHISIKI